MKKNLLIITAGILAIVTVLILLPAGLIAVWPSDEPGATQQLVELVTKEDDLQVPVYLTQEQKIVTMPLEKYVRGVVAAEMPVTFELEALKAQAIAARTYVVRRLLRGDKTEQGAVVTDDHREFQAFSTDEKLQKRWGLIDYPANLSKMNEAVNETRGQVLLYDGQPIEALFFSTSSGKTENSEDYWGKMIPYLRSVPSPWDEQSEKYAGSTTLTVAEFRQKLGVTAIPTAANAASILQILEQTATQHVKKIKVGDQTFAGPDFRTKLGLRSTLFTWEVEGDKITFHTKGFGHGVGLSQYGANGMAKEGRKAEEIVRYYYKGIEIADAKQVLAKKPKG